MSSTIVVAVDHQLLDVAERLMTEFEYLTAGSVLRCFARAVHRARRCGCPISSLPQSAEEITRRLLAGRGHPRPAGRK